MGQSANSALTNLCMCYCSADMVRQRWQLSCASHPRSLAAWFWFSRRGKLTSQFLWHCTITQHREAHLCNSMIVGVIPFADWQCCVRKNCDKQHCQSASCLFVLKSQGHWEKELDLAVLFLLLTFAELQHIQWWDKKLFAFVPLEN